MSKPPTRPTIGCMIREQRNKAGITQEVLAHKCGWKSKTAIAHYERNRSEPTVQNLIRIAKAIGCKFQDLLPHKPSK